MHHPQLPNPVGWDVELSPASELADDWLCTETGPVSDIHIWVSYYQYNETTPPPLPAPVMVRIYRDVPDPDGPGPGHSMPGEEVWIRQFSQIGMRYEDMYGPGNQGWYDPNTGTAIPGDHTSFFQWNIVDIVDPWIQQQGEIYWLSVQLTDPSPPLIGWKTTGPEGRWNDDAVWWAPQGGWVELLEPLDFQESLNLAFVITPEPGTLALLGLGGVAALLARRKRRT